MIRALEFKDVPDLCRIYNHYVSHTTASFEVDEVSENDMAHRVSVVVRHFPWLVIDLEGQVSGFAYANFWKARSSYSHTFESTIYLDQTCCGKGMGMALYKELLAKLKNEKDVHRVVACISLPNDASVKFHESMGYKKVAHFDQVGRKFDRWVDVGYWQLDV